MQVTMAPYPPLDLPAIPRWAAAARVRYWPSTQGTTSSQRWVWYMPVAGESRNWLPPTEVQQSTNTTTTGGGASSPLKRASQSSGKLGRKALRPCHMSSWPVYPWIM